MVRSYFITGTDTDVGKTLVARTLIVRILAFNTPVDITALFMYGRKNTARFSFELVFTLRITNPLNYSTGHFLHINVCTRFNFSSQNNLSGCYKCFASNFRALVVCKKLIKQSIRYLIGYFIGVSFRHRFGGK